MTPTTDPTLATLVPRRTQRRNAVIVAVAVLAMVGAAVYPRLTRPELWTSSGSAGSISLARDRTITMVFETTPRVWSHATVTEVVALPGTHPVGSWLVDDAEYLAASDAAYAELARTGALDDAGEQGAATWRDVAPMSTVATRENALPRTVTSRPVALAVVWRIDDCDVFLAAQQDADRPFVRWRTALGTAWTTTLGESPSVTVADEGDPGRLVPADWLTSTGLCT